MGAENKPIIIIKKKGSHGGHHGGAWKVAYADFVTAMMALFIVLWLMGSSEKVKKAVAGYFNDPKGTASLLGTTTTQAGNGAPDATTDDNLKQLEELKKKLEEEIKAKKEFEKLSKQVEITITPEGLRIELIEDKNGTFYQSGSARLSDSGQELLTLLAGELKTLPNQLLIEGHTDATQYSTDANYGNWELSADRANSARRILQQDGVRADQVTQVRGYADQFLRVTSNPYDPSNRRISILVKNGTNPLPELKNAEVVGGGSQDNSPAPATPAAHAPPTAPAGSAPTALAAPAANASAAAPLAVAASQAQASTSAKPKPGLLAKMTSLLPGSSK